MTTYIQVKDNRTGQIMQMSWPIDCPQDQAKIEAKSQAAYYRRVKDTQTGGKRYKVSVHNS